MPENSHRGRVSDRSRPACMYCGNSVNLEGEDAVTDSRGQTSSSDTTVQVWHRRCFEEYLDQGEET